MFTHKLALIPIALALSLAQPNSAPVLPLSQGGCTKECEPSWVEDMSMAVTGNCATITLTPGALSPGSASQNCATTCSTCDATGAQLDWNCNGSCACVYIWENRSYKNDGSPLPTQLGSGSGTGFARQNVSSKCNSTAHQGTFGVTAGGSRRVFKLVCTCS